MSNGGTLIVFTQQHGYEFEVLPSGQLLRLRWVEDQSCQLYSVGVSQYHPIFSGVPRGTPTLSLNVDGFFTSYPSDSAVLLARTKNGQPAMVLYQYGRGRVLASTLYSDMALGLHQTMGQETALLRDLFAWAVSQDDVETLSLAETSLSIPVHNPYTGAADLPVFQIGDEVTLSINVTNDNLTITADTVKFLVLDPSFNQSWVEVSQGIGAGESALVNLSYPTDGSSEKGVWTVLYFLYAGDDFLGAEMGGRFALGYDPSDYSSFRAIVTVKDPKGNVVVEEEQYVTISPGEAGTIQVSLPATAERGIWSARYSVLMSDGRVLLSSLKRFARSDYAEIPEGWSYQGSEIGFDVTSDHDQVVIGAEETFYIHIYNRGDSDAAIDYYLDWTHKPISEPETVTVPSGSMVTLTHTMAIPSTGRFWANFSSSERGHLGAACKGVMAYHPYVEVGVSTDKTSYTVSDNLVATGDLTNMGPEALGIHTVVQIRDGMLNSLGEQAFDEALPPYGVRGEGATRTRVLTIPLPVGMVAGDYMLVVQSYLGAERIGQDTAYFDFTNMLASSIRLDQPLRSYRAGDPIEIAVDMENVGTSTWESDVEIVTPALGSPVTTHVTLGPGATQILTYPVTVVPASISSGLHQITVTFVEEGYTRTAGFSVPGPRLQINLDTESYNAGDELGLLVYNAGGTYAEWACTMHASFTVDPVSATGESWPRETDRMPVSIPISAAGGRYYVQAQCQASGSTYYLTKYVDISGSDITLALADSQYSAGEVVSITMINTGTVDTTSLCRIDLTDEHGFAIYQESGTSKFVAGGGSETLSFTIPDWAASGQYGLQATCVDTNNSKVASLVRYLDISGVEASLTSVTDRGTYNFSDNIDVLTQTINSAQPLSGTLHLWMWEAAQSQVAAQQEWAKHDGSTGTDTPEAIAVDADGNVYVTGSRYNGANTDYGTIKYSSQGTKLWEAIYAGGSAQNDAASAIAVDAAGNVYVTGMSYEQKPGSLTTAKMTCTTVKYNATGAQQWVKSFHGTGNSFDECMAIAVGGGFVYVAGRSGGSGTSSDYITIKYDAITGVQQWASRYNGPGNMMDGATGLALDADGNVYVAGYTYAADMNMYYATIKYNSAGTQQWVSQSDYSAGGYPAYIAFRQAEAGEPGYLLMAGSVYRGAYADFALIKYDTTDGGQEWAQYYDGSYGNNDTVVGLAVDNAGNAYVAGGITVGVTVEMFDVDFGVLKYSASGDLLWEASYGVPDSQRDMPAGLALDADGDVYVAGSIWTQNWTYEWATLKLDGDTGAQVWVTGYTGLDSGDDQAAAIAVSPAGGIYVTGTSSGNYATVKYVERQAGDAVWETDIPVDLAASETKDVSTLVNIPTELAGITGKLYLGARLLNSGSQVIAESEPHCLLHHLQ